MALKKEMSLTTFGKELLFDSAYHQIDTLSGNKERISIIINVYDTDLKENLIDQKSYFFTPNVQDDAPNFIKQGYEYLKTLDEYQGSIDVLEEGQSAI
ncbi:hypothetical protein ASG61_22960 [Bacillus sp. Leaf75]|nr:hypothetical protein ASG61_22960 [Bacillus sp. Leaf75]